MTEQRRKSRETVAQSTVTFARTVVTWPGRIGGWLVTLLAWWGAWEIGGVALKQQPSDFKLLMVALAVWGFGTAFAFPERFVTTIRLVADAWDKARSTRE